MEQCLPLLRKIVETLKAGAKNLNESCKKEDVEQITRIIDKLICISEGNEVVNGLECPRQIQKGVSEINEQLQHVLAESLTKIKIHQNLLDPKRKTIGTESDQKRQKYAYLSSFRQKILKISHQKPKSFFSQKILVYLLLIEYKIALFKNKYSAVEQTCLEELLLNTIKQFKNIDNYHTFAKNIFLMMGFNTDLKTYEKMLGVIQDRGNKEVQIRNMAFDQIMAMIGSWQKCQRQQPDQTKNTQIQRLLDQLIKQPINLHDFMQFLAHLVISDTKSQKVTLHRQNSQFSSYSKIVYQVLNLRTQRTQQISENSFNIEFNRFRNVIVRKILVFLSQNDQQLRTNDQLVKQIGAGETFNDKIVVLALRKLFLIHFNKINQVVIRQWLVKRRYVFIWIMFFCKIKVKTVCEQIVKNSITPTELCCFFRLSTKIVSDYVEYLAYKDKFKFRLSLWNNECIDQDFLIEYNPVNLLVL